MSKNYLMVNKNTNLVENVVLWDGNLQTWNPGDDFLLMKAEDHLCTAWFWVDGELQSQQALGIAGIGDSWDGTAFSKQQPPKPEPLPAPAAPVQLTDGGPSVVVE